MKAFVFSPSNTCIGKLEISDVGELPHKVEAFLRVRLEIKKFSYVEVGPAFEN